MRKLILALALIGSAWGQSGSAGKPTVYFTPIYNVAGVIPLGVTPIPPQYMIGQYTHTLTVILSNNGGTCSANNLVLGLDGSPDNVKWVALGAPITQLTGSPGISGQLTGTTVLYGSFPFLRLNVLRAFGTNCRTTVNYVGSTTPVSFSTSLPQLGDQYLSYWVNNLDLTTLFPIAITSNPGGRISLFGLQITNNDAAAAANYTISLFNKGTGACATSGGSLTESLFVYRVLAGQSLRVGFGDIPFFSAPTGLTVGSASSLSTYDAVAGFYVVCIQASAANLTTVNVVYKSY